MMSITTILILFTAFIAISGEILDLRSSINRSRLRVSYLDRLFHQNVTVLKYDKLYLMRAMRPLHISFDEFQTSPTADTTNKHIVSRQGIRRIRRQALVENRGTDGGPGSIMQLSSPSFDIYRGGVQPITILKVIAWMHQQLSIKLMNRIQNGDVPREFFLARPDIFIE